MASDDKPGLPRVLVIDDSRVMRKAIAKILADEAELADAVDGEQGWAQLVEDPGIHVVITDIEMPVLDGYSLICRIRAHDDDERIRNVPIIAITGAEDEETKRRAFACGATDFITKPLDATQLKARVRAHAKLDETARQLAETSATLEREATSDPLTDLNSRRYLLQRGQQDLAHAVRHGTPLSLIRVDIDRLRKLYREHGDDIVNRILVWVARVLGESARKEDTVARIGGAEFAVLAPTTGKSEALVLCQRIREGVKRRPFEYGEVEIPLTVSIGVATHGADPADTLEDMLALAEARLQDAKGDGGDRVSASSRSELMPELEEVTLDAPDIPEVAPTEESNSDKAPPAAAGHAMPVDLIDINHALRMLGNGQAERVAPYVLELARRILPLLEFCNEHHALDIHKELDVIRKKTSGAD